MASVILIACITVLGIIIVISLFLAGGYLWWRHKRSQLQFIEPNEDEDSSSYSMRLPQSSTQEMQQEASIQPIKPPQQQPQPIAATPIQNNINRKLNGFLNLKTPLIGFSATFELQYKSTENVIQMYLFIDFINKPTT